MFFMKSDQPMLKRLRNFNMPHYEVDAAKAHVASILNTKSTDILAHSIILRKKAGWGDALAMIARRKADDRGIGLTILPNEDTAAALLAIRLGIEVHLAVALAHKDLIEARPLNDGEYAGGRIGLPEGSLLATFSPVGCSAASHALFAHQDAWTFVPEFAPEEYMLLHITDTAMRTSLESSYFVNFMKGKLRYRTKEVVYCQAEVEGAA